MDPWIRACTNMSSKSLLSMILNKPQIYFLLVVFCGQSSLALFLCSTALTLEQLSTPQTVQLISLLRYLPPFHNPSEFLDFSSSLADSKLW